MTSRYAYEVDQDIAAKCGLKLTSDVTKPIATNNNRGYQMSSVSPLCDVWITKQPKTENNLPLLDIGCAFGINTFYAAHSNKKDVICVDMDERCLNYIKLFHEKQKKTDENVKIITLLAPLPHLKGLNESSVSSILCAEVIHFLTGPELVIAFQRFYDILCSKGILCITCTSENAYPLTSAFRDVIKQRKLEGNQFPGYFDGELFQKLRGMSRNRFDEKQLELDVKFAAPPMVHLLSVSQVATLAENAGFVVLSIQQTQHFGYPPHSGGELCNIQLVAIKF